MGHSEELAQRIWALCDILRDDGITYHQYINELSYLLFLKMAAEGGTEAQLPPECRWGHLSAQNGEDQYALYKRILVDLGNTGQGIVRQIFANPTSLLRRSASLNAMVANINALAWHDADRERFGDIYESLLKYAGEKRSGAGQYFTPRVLIGAIVRVMKPRAGEIIQDPALGTAGFLVAAHRYVTRTHQGRGEACYVGVELVPENYRLALMNTFVHGMTGSYFLEDTLSPFGTTVAQADLVLTNPPFGSRKGAGSPTRQDLPYSTSNKQIAFLQHIIATLKPGGRAAVVVPDNVLFENGVGRHVRTMLLERCNLHTLLRLPTGIFYAAGVHTNVLFFTRGTTDTENTREVWVYDLRTNMPAFGRRLGLTDDHFKEFEHAFGGDPTGSLAGLEHRTDSGEEGRFRRYSRKWIAEREDSLDISWLSGDSARRSDESATDPAALAHDAILELDGARNDLRAILAELGEAELD